MTAVAAGSFAHAASPPRTRAHILGTALATLAAIAVLAAVAPGWLPYAPGTVSGPAYEAPSRAHLLGTDDLGQDVLSNVVAGARLSLVVGLGVAAVSTAIAWAIGLLAGSTACGGALVAATDLLLAIPLLPLLVLVAAHLGPSTGGTIAALGCLTWPAFARIVRTQVLSTREREHVLAAHALGARPLRVLLRHILPETIPIMLTKFILTVRWAILMQASLAFLGLGDPGDVSWGVMLSGAFRDPLVFVRPAWLWSALPPAAAIAAVTVSLTLLAQRVERRRVLPES